MKKKTIIEKAFEEGRETNTSWKASKARKNEIKMEIAMNNYEMFQKRDAREVIKLQQICPDTGKVLNTFKSRFEAAKYLVVNGFTNQTGKKSAYGVTQNMDICMRIGWKSYGFYWKIVK